MFQKAAFSPALVSAASFGKEPAWVCRRSLVAPADVAAIGAAWADLAREAVEANPFYAPWMLGPALDRLGGDGIRLFCVWDEGATGGLIGLVPLEAAPSYGRLPSPHIRNWVYAHCFFGAPLVRRGFETSFFAALFAYLDAEAPAAGFIRLRLLDQDGPLARGLTAAARDRRLIYPAGGFARAVLRGGYRADEFLGRNVRKKKLQELKRRRKRLSEIAALRFRMLCDNDDLEAWTETFLRLEDSGWKGRAGTSFAKSAAQREFLRDALRGARAAGELQFARLDIGESAIAMMINFTRDGQSYGFKICHDEAYARYSPGVLIELALIEALESMKPGAFVDSCAAPDHAMINSLWPDRRRITGLNISKASAMSRLGLGFCRLLEEASQKAKLS
ncbi:MAG: GNAT family N-acetyltransferase [Alphaproteobacteria bacterium]|nr:GNAT family N-acetyltransferase [Alphaproteobacteria bacterium]